MNDQDATRAAGSSAPACSAIRQFICVFDNGETFVSWQANKQDAAAECRLKAGREPWRILATGKRMPNLLLDPNLQKPGKTVVMEKQ